MLIELEDGGYLNPATVEEIGPPGDDGRCCLYFTSGSKDMYSASEVAQVVSALRGEEAVRGRRRADAPSRREAVSVPQKRSADSEAREVEAQAPAQLPAPEGVNPRGWRKNKKPDDASEMISAGGIPILAFQGPTPGQWQDSKGTIFWEGIDIWTKSVYIAEQPEEGPK
jgi:hypothetical protein